MLSNMARNLDMMEIDELWEPAAMEENDLKIGPSEPLKNPLDILTKLVPT